MRCRWGLGAAALALAALLAPEAGDSCGPFFPEMRFTTYHGLAADELAKGQYGVVRPHFWRADLIVAYRAFSGVPLREDEDAAPPAALDPQWNRAEDWLKARGAVPGASHIDFLRADRKVPGGDYEMYPNCLDAAFSTAAETLRKRIAQWGAASPQLAEWLRGQDQVFQNCSEGAAIPAPIAGASAELAADRQYQIAAAELYAEQYDRAEADFDRIAANAASPWHGIAPYLAARAAIRAATIGGVTGKLQGAAGRLRAILADPAQQQWHDSAQGLLDFIRVRTEPRQRLVELGQQLVKPGLGEQFGPMLREYTTIWDRLEANKEQPPAAESDLAAWIAAYQNRTPGNVDWHTRHALPWLAAALVWAPANDPAGGDLIRDARAVPPDSPAYATVSYYGILRQIRAGQLEAARQWAGEALGKVRAPSAMNLLRAERFRLARGWPDFLEYATRKPIGSSTEGDSDEPLTDGETKQNPEAFDEDAVQSLNQATPLALWVDAARNERLPRNLRARIARAGWVRAVVLGGAATARTLARRVAELQPELAAEMRKYLAETDEAGARFTAVFLMLRGPGLEPVIRSGFGRPDRTMERSVFRDNWWSFETRAGRPVPAGSDHEALYDIYPDGKTIPPDFLPRERRAAGEAEWEALQDRAVNGVNYLCAETLAWARSHPQDPRVPQALHEAVNATHYGPADTDKLSSGYSKQAFDLLHRRYPESEWTRQTKYWY